MTDVKAFQKNWRKNLDELPATPEKIPSFFFGHGSPLLAFPDNNDRDFFGGGIMAYVLAYSGFWAEKSPELLRSKSRSECRIETHNLLQMGWPERSFGYILEGDQSETPWPSTSIDSAIGIWPRAVKEVPAQRHCGFQCALGDRH
jgi:hypothetical protein